MSEIITFLAACGGVFGPMVAWCLVERHCERRSPIDPSWRT